MQTKTNCRSSKLPKLFGASFFALNGFAAGLSHAANQPGAPSACDVVRNAQDLSGKVIELHAEYETDGYHYTHLMDPRCPHSDAISVVVFPEFTDEPSIQSLLKITFQGQAGTLDKKIVGTFRGKFNLHADQFSKYELELQHVENLQVEPRQEVDEPLPKGVLPYK